MSDPTDDEESTENLWDDLEEFAESDSADDVFVETDLEAGTDPESSDNSPADSAVDPPADSPADAFGEHDSIAADDHAPTADAPDADEVFDEMDVSGVDGEALWDQLAGAEADAEAFDRESVDEDDASIDTEPVEPSVEAADQSTDSDDSKTLNQSTDSDDTETLVDKRAYCQQCPFFSEPPDVSCSHDGTEISEVLQDGQFRVRNCPVVTDTGPDRTILNDGH